MRKALLAIVTASITVLLWPVAPHLRAQNLVKLQYPVTRTVAIVDDYFGTRVPDPYRWLEDENSPETAAWVEAQNKVTFGELDKIPFRSGLKDRLEKLYNYAKYSAPTRRGNSFFFFKND